MCALIVLLAVEIISNVGVNNKVEKWLLFFRGQEGHFLRCSRLNERDHLNFTELVEPLN